MNWIVCWIEWNWIEITPWASLTHAHMSHLGFAVAHCVSQHSPSPLSSPSPPSSGSGSTGRCDSVTASTISAQSPAGSSHAACFSPHRHTDVTVTALYVGNSVYCICTTHTHTHPVRALQIEHTYNAKSRLSSNDHVSCQTSQTSSSYIQYISAVMEIHRGEMFIIPSIWNKSVDGVLMVPVRADVIVHVKLVSSVVSTWMCLLHL